MLGEDLDKTEEELEQQNKDKKQEKRVHVTSDGTVMGTKILTSDGLNLGEYGIVAASWEVVANPAESLLTLVFYGPIVDLDYPLSLTQIMDIKCTCDISYWAQLRYDNPSLLVQFKSLIHAIVAPGGHHYASCPRFEVHEESCRINRK